MSQLGFGRTLGDVYHANNPREVQPLNPTLNWSIWGLFSPTTTSFTDCFWEALFDERHDDWQLEMVVTPYQWPSEQAAPCWFKSVLLNFKTHPGSKSKTSPKKMEYTEHDLQVLGGCVIDTLSL